MKYLSTRGSAKPVGFSGALQAGLAPDGGLYVPESFPKLDPRDFDSARSITEAGERLLSPFFQGDRLEPKVGEILRRAFDFPAPLRFVGEDTAVLELFHGPTAAFKDFGARFLAQCAGSGVVWVATSGDTGGAVAAAFFEKPGVEVKLFFPKGKVSARQEKQLTSFGGNIRAYAVRGTFDDCQRLVKEALSRSHAEGKGGLISANSINIGRLLPQMSYYAWASLEYLRKTGKKPGIIVPTGNLGNAVAALWAKRCGLPIREVILATNANRSIADYFETGEWIARPSRPTLANAMDVGNPSNMERLLHLYAGNLAAMSGEVSAISVSDEQIRETIRRGKRDWGSIWCPHTATAVFAREKLGGADWILVATAHPAKFETIVEPLVGETIPVPAELARILSRPSSCEEIESRIDPENN